MGLLDRIAADVTSAWTAPEGAAARQSPQGWEDLEPGWPEPGPGAWAQHFEDPWAAASFVAMVFQGLGDEPSDPSTQRHARALDELARGLAALQLAPSALRERRGTYGRLAALLAEHRPRHPALFADPLVARQVQVVVAALRRCPDPGLRQLGWELDQAAPPPRPEDAPTPDPGDPASLSARKVYELLATRCLADRGLTGPERQALEDLADLLAIPEDERRQAVGRASLDAAMGTPGPAADLDPEALLMDLEAAARADGQVTPAEREVLDVVTRFFGLAPTTPAT